jgi:hypothetical protein
MKAHYFPYLTGKKPSHVIMKQSQLLYSIIMLDVFQYSDTCSVANSENCIDCVLQ